MYRVGWACQPTGTWEMFIPSFRHPRLRTPRAFPSGIGDPQPG